MKRVARAAIASGLALCAVTMAGTAALAKTTTVTGTTTSSTWVNYATTRTTTQSSISFQALDRLYQGGPIEALNLRLLNSGGSVLSAGVLWTDSSSKTLISNLATGYSFRMSACCYSTVGADTTWSGPLTY